MPSRGQSDIAGRGCSAARKKTPFHLPSSCDLDDGRMSRKEASADLPKQAHTHMGGNRHLKVIISTLI